MKLPKLKIWPTGYNYEGTEVFYCIKPAIKGHYWFTKAQAEEVIRRCEKWDEVIDLLRYFYNLPCNGVGENHKAMLNKAEQMLKGEQDE